MYTFPFHTLCLFKMYGYQMVLYETELWLTRLHPGTRDVTKDIVVYTIYNILLPKLTTLYQVVQF